VVGPVGDIASRTGGVAEHVSAHEVAPPAGYTGACPIDKVVLAGRTDAVAPGGIGEEVVSTRTERTNHA
jgi:hypothetical protein